jgi:hypothetical protein
LRALVEAIEQPERKKPELKKQFSEALWQSRIMRLVKTQRRLTIDDLFSKLQSQFGLESDKEAFDEALKRLGDMQYILISSDSIEYVP